MLSWPTEQVDDAHTASINHNSHSSRATGIWHLEKGYLWWNCIRNAPDSLLRLSSIFKLVWKLQQYWMKNVGLYPEKWLKINFFLGTFPPFHIQFFFPEILVPVKFKHTHNFLCQGRIYLTTILSEYYLVCWPHSSCSLWTAESTQEM